MTYREYLGEALERVSWLRDRALCRGFGLHWSCRGRVDHMQYLDGMWVGRGRWVKPHEPLGRVLSWFDRIGSN